MPRRRSNRIVEICGLDDGSTGGADGVRYDTSTVRGAVIRETAHYAGYRVRMQAHVARARPIMSIDVNCGDPVVPGPRRISHQGLRPGMEPFMVLSYPVETIIAEKLCNAVQLGDANTRVRDYLDIWRLIRNEGLDAAAMRSALEATAAFRGQDLSRSRPQSQLSRTGGRAITKPCAGSMAWRPVNRPRRWRRLSRTCHRSLTPFWAESSGTRTGSPRRAAGPEPRRGGDAVRPPGVTFVAALVHARCLAARLATDLSWAR